MATYNKKLKTLEIHLLLDGANPITIADTADDNKATRALNEFKKYGTMHFEEDQGGAKFTRAIPYEAVQYIKVTETDASVNKADPYGCEGQSVTITFDPCDYSIETPSPITANKGEVVTLPVVDDQVIHAWGKNCDGSAETWGQGAEFTATENITLCFVNDR